MPSLVRLLVFCVIIAGIILGTMIFFSRVDPVNREMRAEVPSDIINERNAARLPKEETDGKQAKKQ